MNIDKTGLFLNFMLVLYSIIFFLGFYFHYLDYKEKDSYQLETIDSMPLPEKNPLSITVQKFPEESVNCFTYGEAISCVNSFEMMGGVR